MELITATEARKNFNELINRVHYGDERIVISRHNQEAAVLISPKDYSRLQQFERESKSSYDFFDLVGKLEWQGDILKVQQELRDEW